MVDMHIHSTYSDGSDNVSEICEKTKAYDFFSITDHNNIMANKIVRASNYISGVEFSISGGEVGVPQTEIHLLAYGFNPYDNELNKLIDDYNYYNNLVNYKIIINIALKYKLKIDFELLKKIVDSKVTLNKVYITKLLMEIGYGEELFKTYNKYVKECMNVQHYYSKFKEVLRVIKDSNGYLLLAHPYGYGLDKQVEEVIAKLAKLGIDGIEMDFKHQDEIRNFIDKYNFLYSIGSDYHGIANYRTLGIDDNKYLNDDSYLRNRILA